MAPPVRWKLPFACSSLLAVALVLTGSALAGNGGIAPPGKTPNAERIRDLYWLVLAVTGVVFVVVEATLVMFVVKYRSRGRPREEEGPQIRGHTRLELIWTVIPALILAVIIAVVFYKLPGIKDVPEANAAGAPKMTVQVEGRQFYWRYTYPNGAVSVNELRLPTGLPVDLEITAPANDVAHSWWVPALAGKMDAIPGKVNHLRFETPASPGLYKGQCAEFCGVQHALMVAQVQTLAPAEFNTWVSAQLKTGADLGKQTFDGACGPCHGLSGEGLIGPKLQGSAAAANAERVRALVTQGGILMPAVGKGWNDQQLRALVQYVQKDIARVG
jgi:cytochrome c oxidase subunit 2